KYAEGIYKRSEASFYGENRPPRARSLRSRYLKYCSTVIFDPSFLIRRTSDGRVEIRQRPGLFSLPPDSVAGILEDDADRREGVANSVRGREVFPLAGVLTQRNDQVEEAVHEARPLRGWLEDPQHLAKVRYACAASSRAPRPTPV